MIRAICPVLFFLLASPLFSCELGDEDRFPVRKIKKSDFVSNLEKYPGLRFLPAPGGIEAGRESDSLEVENTLYAIAGPLDGRDYIGSPVYVQSNEGTRGALYGVLVGNFPKGE